MKTMKFLKHFVIISIGVISYLVFSFFMSVLPSQILFKYIPVSIGCFFIGYFAERKYWLYSLIFTIFFISFDMISIRDFHISKLLLYCTLFPTNIIVSCLGGMLSTKKFIKDIFIVTVGYLICFILFFPISIISKIDVIMYIPILFSSIFVGYFVTKRGWLYGGILGLLITIQVIIVSTMMIKYHTSNWYWYLPMINESWKLLVECCISVLGGYVGENIKNHNLKKIIIPTTILLVSGIIIAISQEILELQSKSIITRFSELDKKKIYKEIHDEHLKIIISAKDRKELQDNEKFNVYTMESLKLINKKMAKKYNLSENELNIILKEGIEKNWFNSEKQNLRGVR